MRCIFLTLLLCFTHGLFSQDQRLKQRKLDSLNQKLQKDSAFIFRSRLAKPYLRVENRYSFISKKPVNLVGFMAGATFIERHILCAGYYTLNRLRQKSIQFTDENNVTRKEYLVLNYFIFSYQYILWNKRYFQLHVPVEIGYGLYHTETKDSFDNFLKKSSGDIIPASVGLQFIFKPVKWAGLSMIGGYRHVIQEKNIDLNFRGFYYSFGLWVDARHVIRSVRYHYKKKHYREAVEGL